MFYSFSVKEFKTCLQYGLINKREACFNLGRGDGKGCKGRKVRFNSVQEEQDGQLYCDFFLLFFFQDGGGSLAPLGKCLIPCSDLLCGHSCPERLKMKRKLSRRNSGRKGFKIMLADWETLFNQRRNCKKNQLCSHKSFTLCTKPLGTSMELRYVS